MAEHSTLTGSNLHEPKGIASAAADTVYVADGAGSGAFVERRRLGESKITLTLTDVSTAETIYLPIPYAGTIVKVVTVLENAITTADATITVKNTAGLSMGTLTITQAGSAAGDVDTLEPASNNTVADDSYVTVETDGASNTAARLFVTIVVQRS